MEKKLKKERGKLFRRVILILLAVWLAASAVFCVIRLSIEKANAQSRELSAFSIITQILSEQSLGNEAINFSFLQYTDLVYDEDKPVFDSHLRIYGEENGEVALDSAKSAGLRFYYTDDAGSTHMAVGMLNYDSIAGALSEKQLGTITEYLNREPENDGRYELICTKMHADFMFVPLELKLVFISSENSEITETIETFSLEKNRKKDKTVFDCSSNNLSIIPRDFLLKKQYNPNLIDSLTKSQKKSTGDMFEKGSFTYIFYASETTALRSDGTAEATENNSVTFQYAKEINLIKNCQTDLLAGTAVLFVFFSVIAAILCIMIWRTVKAQIIQEQKRLDFTNALAHDIKTPLFVIDGYAYSLKENIDEDERDLYLDKIIEQTGEINGLVHRMLSYSKLDSYNMTLNKEDFDLFALTKSVTENYANMNIALKHSGNNTVNADKELVKTAVQNIINNAVKYTLPGGEITVDVNGKRLTVSNPAEPITKTELKQLYQPYVRKDKSRSKKGNGLGLSIVKSIADSHGAKTEIEMKNGLFIIRLEL